MVKIEYILRGKSLGVYDIRSRSTQADRDAVARANGIEDYDRFILDGGRVVAARVGNGLNLWTDEDGQQWMSWEMVNSDGTISDISKSVRVVNRDLGRQYPMRRIL